MAIVLSTGDLTRSNLFYTLLKLDVDHLFQLYIYTILNPDIFCLLSSTETRLVNSQQHPLYSGY